MKSQFLFNQQISHQTPYFHYQKTQVITNKPSQIDVQKYQEQLKQISQQPKQQNIGGNEYEQEEQLKLAIRQQMQNNQNIENDVQKPYHDQYSQVQNEETQKEQDKQLNFLMNKFFEVDLLNFGNVSLKTLLDDLSGQQ